ncbi:hypothetical protein ISCGN_018906 [Ixodes scapularis]
MNGACHCLPWACPPACLQNAIILHGLCSSVRRSSVPCVPCVPSVCAFCCSMFGRLCIKQGGQSVAVGGRYLLLRANSAAVSSALPAPRRVLHTDSPTFESSTLPSAAQERHDRCTRLRPKWQTSAWPLRLLSHPCRMATPLAMARADSLPRTSRSPSRPLSHRPSPLQSRSQWQGHEHSPRLDRRRIQSHR